jgi:hypothetical protein
MFDPKDPTRSLAPRKPMSPEELDKFRPSATPSYADEVKALTYKIGLREIEPLIRRLVSLERIVVEQDIKILALQNTTLQLKYPNTKV